MIVGVIIILTFALSTYYGGRGSIFSVVLDTGLGLFWAFFAIPIRQRVVTTTKYAFIRGYYDPDVELVQISDALAAAHTVPRMIHIMVKALDRVLQIETELVFIKNASGRYDGYDDGKLIEKDALTKQFPVILYSESRVELEKYEALPRDVQALLGSAGRGVLIPCHGPEGLVGVVYLGARSGQKTYLESDVAFLKMVNRLASNFFYKLAPYDHIAAEFRKTQQKLYDASLQLARASAIERFAHQISQWNHEMRSPLTNIRNAVHLLQSEDQIPMFKESIEHQIQRALVIIEQSLLLSNAKLVPAQHAPVRISEVLSVAINLVQPPYTIEKSGEMDTWVMGNTKELELVFTNLVTNAISEMPNGGKIGLRCERVQNDVIISVSDTGPGIPDEMKETIWQLFVTGKKGGFGNKNASRGMGLSIVQRIVMDHHGTVNVESQLGQGATFYVRLPVVDGKRQSI